LESDSLLATQVFPHDLLLLVTTTLVAVGNAALGVWLTSAHQTARRMVAFGGGLLAGISLFGVLPELAQGFGWVRGAALLALGGGVLWVVDRFIYPVCPTCAHSHNHQSCATALHGFGAPLIAAAALHSLLDGWGILASQHGGYGEAGVAVALAILLHKIPEGLAFGAILRAAFRSRAAAIAWCVVAEGCTLVGGLAEAYAAPRMGADWIRYPLALAGGSFLYLGAHAVHEEWRRRGVTAAAMPALAGATGAAVLQQGLQVLFR
jgi:zinc and cadmium transporter